MKINIRHNTVGFFNKRKVVEIDFNDLQHAYEETMKTISEYDNTLPTNNEELADFLQLKTTASILEMLIFVDEPEDIV